MKKINNVHCLRVHFPHFYFYSFPHAYVCSVLSQFNTTLNSLPRKKEFYHLAWLLHRKTILIRKYCKPSMPAYSVNTKYRYNVHRREKMYKNFLSISPFNFINSHCSNQPPAYADILYTQVLCTKDICYV